MAALARCFFERSVLAGVRNWEARKVARGCVGDGFFFSLLLGLCGGEGRWGWAWRGWDRVRRMWIIYSGPDHWFWVPRLEC